MGALAPSRVTMAIPGVTATTTLKPNKNQISMRSLAEESDEGEQATTQGQEALATSRSTSQAHAMGVAMQPQFSRVFLAEN